MKKLRKVKTTLKDSIEAYAGVCNCAIVCYCYCTPEAGDKATLDYSSLESSSLSISLSHYNWA